MVRKGKNPASYLCEFTAILCSRENVAAHSIITFLGWIVERQNREIAGLLPDPRFPAAKIGGDEKIRVSCYPRFFPTQKGCQKGEIFYVTVFV